MKNMKVLTLNLHKGFSALNLKYVLPEVRDALRIENPDLVFLQEVLGEEHEDIPSVVHNGIGSQYEYLADSIWNDFAYARNAVYSRGHHGNAILSRFPIKQFQQVNITTYPLEQRGFLHAQIQGPDLTPVHCICVHLGLFNQHRKEQFKVIVDHTELHIPAGAPLIVAGDMNDWSHSAKEYLAVPLGLRESFSDIHGKLALTFPARLPLLRLDRIYSRQFQTRSASVLSGKPWSSLSDHLPLVANLEFTGVHS